MVAFQGVHSCSRIVSITCLGAMWFRLTLVVANDTAKGRDSFRKNVAQPEQAAN